MSMINLRRMKTQDQNSGFKIYSDSKMTCKDGQTEIILSSKRWHGRKGCKP